MTRERRHFPRVPEAFEVRCRPAGDFSSGWEAVTVLNLGAGGIRFRGHDPLLLPGSLLEIKLTVPGSSEELILQGRVAWSEMPASGVTESGVEFTNLTPKHQTRIDQLVSFLKGRV